MKTDIDGARVLAVPMKTNDANAATIREYLVALTRALWVEAEGFSSKRPFGDSDWQDEVVAALYHAGMVPGELDADGDLDYASMWGDHEELIDSLMSAALDELAHGPTFTEVTDAEGATP